MANEKRLISVTDCPCDGCKAKPCGHPARCVKFTLWLNKTVDAVEVVRCKDCRYFDMTHGRFDHLCSKMVRYMGADDFCSYGERKDNGED